MQTDPKPRRSVKRLVVDIADAVMIVIRVGPRTELAPAEVLDREPADKSDGETSVSIADQRQCAGDVIHFLRDDNGPVDKTERQVVAGLRAKKKDWPVETVRAALEALYAAGMVGKDGRAWFAE